MGPATEKTPQQNPKKNRPKIIIQRFRNIVNVIAMAAKKLNFISAYLLPVWINLPPMREPNTTPKMAAELINVLNKTASLSFHPNLALITGAV